MKNRRWSFGAVAVLVVSGCGGNASQDQDAGTQDGEVTLQTPPEGTRLDAPARGTSWLCPRLGISPPPLSRVPRDWVTGDTIHASRIPYVQGSMTWQSQMTVTLTDTTRVIHGNGLPNHPTGMFPVQPGTPAYPFYASNPALPAYPTAADIPIAAYDLSVTLPRNPQPNATPTCLHWVTTGVSTESGATWHFEMAPDPTLHLFDPAVLLPVDHCFGHPYNTQYHYHGYSWACFHDQGDPSQHSPLYGYALDGFGIYGPRGEDGQTVTNAELDECHGHTHMINWDGQMRMMYHYHLNYEYPHSIGCFRGTPVDPAADMQY